jgi:predicted enzyme related to lactoylglutathione lyase
MQRSQELTKGHDKSAKKVFVMPRVIHFEINADNPERAMKFYRKVFDWKIKKWEGPADYWLVTTGEDKQPGINGAIMHRMGKGTIYNTIDVPSVDKFLKKIVEAGGKAVQKKTAVPGVGYMAYCADTEGNIFGIMEEDTSAR